MDINIFTPLAESGDCLCVYSHSLLIKLVSDASWHVFKDSDTAWHQLQLVILVLYDQLHTCIHT